MTFPAYSYTQLKIKKLMEHKIYLNPTLFEGFGKSFIEGMAAGCCVVGTNVGAAIDYIEDGETGVIIKRRDSADIFSKIEYLFNNPGKMEDISKAAFLKVRDLSWKTLAKATLDFYDTILMTGVEK